MFRLIDIDDFIDYNDSVASITIRKLPDDAKERLRVDAARSGISLEAYARQILREASGDALSPAGNLAELARGYFGKGAGVDLELPERGSKRENVEFGV
jgi:plasmid stability protein